LSRGYQGAGSDGTLRFDAASAPAVGALTPDAVAYQSSIYIPTTGLYGFRLSSDNLSDLITWAHF
jgi:hypothetical protein